MDLKRMLNLKHRDVLGLDIGSCTVKIVALRKDNAGYVITAAGITQIADGRHDNNVVGIGYSGIDANTISAIRDCFTVTKLRARNRLRTRLAVCGVSGPEVAVRDFELPPLPTEDVEGAVLLEAEQICPFNVDQAAVDYQLISNGNGQSQTRKTRGIMVAATNGLVTSKIQMAKEAGLKCVLVDVDGLALLNCFNNLTDGQQKSTAAILNIGGTYTTLAITNDGRPFIRDTSCAGDDIIRQIADENEISPETAMDILFDESPDSQTELGNSLEKASEELITDVAETLRFYAASEKSTPVDKIFACGGFAPAKGFVELLSHRLGVEVCLWNPCDQLHRSVSGRRKDIFTKTGPALAVAAGLAMRSIETAHRQ